MRQLTKLLSHVEESQALRVYPELARLESVSDRGKALRAARKAIFSGSWNLVGSFYFFMMVGVPLLLFLFYYVGLPQSQPSLLYLFCAILFGAAGLYLLAHILFILLTRAWTRRRLWQELRKRGVPICLRCGYDLTGCPSDRCPECGTVTSRSLRGE